MTVSLKLVIYSIFCLSLTLSAGFLRADPSVKVIPLKTDNPERVLKTLQQLYGDEGFLGVANHRLVIRAEDRIIEEITALLEKIDRPPRLLTVTIANSPPPDGEPDGESVTTYSTADTDNNLQTLTVKEGVQIYLARFKSEQRIAGGGLYWVSVKDEPTEVTSISLLVLANDPAVELNVEYFGRTRRDSQHLNLTVGGKLGEWISIFPEEIKAENEIKTYSTEDARLPHQKLFVKVQPLLD